MQRTLITLLLFAGSLAVVFGLFVYSGDGNKPAEPPTETTTPEVVDNTSPAPAAEDPATAVPAPEVPGNENAVETATTAPSPVDSTPPTESLEPAPPTNVSTFVIMPADPQPEPTIGSDQPDNAGGFLLKAQFSPWNAGLITADLAEHSKTAIDHIPYRVQAKVPYKNHEGQTAFFYPMGSNSIRIKVQGQDREQEISLSHCRWTVTSDPDAAKNGGVASFELVIGISADGDAAPKPALKLLRTWRLLPGRYDLLLDQKLINLTGQPLQVTFSQFGPTDLPYQTAYMGDQRQLYFGYVEDGYPGHVFRADSDVAGGRRASLADRALSSRGQIAPIWPTDTTNERGYHVSYAAMANRYFTAAVIPQEREAQAGKFIDPTWTVDNVFPQTYAFAVSNGGVDGGNYHTTDRDPYAGGVAASLMTIMQSGVLDLPAGGEKALDVAFYAGPKSHNVFEEGTLYQRLGLDKLVIYETQCFCSSHSVAAFLHWLLEVFHIVVRDWGLAIIVLTIVVRLILHPVTKKSQLNMMRFSKQMQKLQPEIQKLKDKYKDDSQKLNQEMMKLYKEKGVNPAGMAMGCLPMFLQTPIWIALWAMLFYAIELRHTPAFFDVFHRLGEMVGWNWRFLTDLSSPDQFIALPEDYHFTVPLIGRIMGKITAINILPILLIFTYWAQQKFMQPATDPSQVSEQAAQQQKMMRIMMLTFPIFLFGAPSGLTLYMLASSISGIIDGKLVRKKLKEMEDAGEFDKPKTPKQPKPGGFMDRLQKAAEERQKMLQQAQQPGKQGGKKNRKGKGKR